MPTTQTEPDLVRAPERMTDEFFAMHMNKRHSDSLGGLPFLDSEMTTRYVIRCWRAFHRQLHKWHVNLEHEHAER